MIEIVPGVWVKPKAVLMVNRHTPNDDKHIRVYLKGKSDYLVITQPSEKIETLEVLIARLAGDLR